MVEVFLALMPARRLGTNINQDSWSRSRLGDPSPPQVLIDSKALVGVKTKMQDTALHLAAEAGHTKVLDEAHVPCICWSPTLRIPTNTDRRD